MWVRKNPVVQLYRYYEDFPGAPAYPALRVSIPTPVTHRERTILRPVPLDLGRQNGDYIPLKSLSDISR